MTLLATEFCRPHADEVVRLDAVTRHYTVGDEVVRALDGISFVMRKGSYWAIMGPSGSGKSTLMQILGFLDRPTNGEYLFEGKNKKLGEGGIGILKA